METQQLSLPAFEDLLDRWGDEIERWPAEWRTPARRLLAASAAARASLDEVRRLRELLRAAPPVQVPAGLLERILTSAAATSSRPAADSSSRAATAPPLAAPNGLKLSPSSPDQHRRASAPRRDVAPRQRG